MKERPLVFVGETRSKYYLQRLQDLGWGRMWTERQRTEGYPGEPWAFDNGAYAAHLAGRPFPERDFLRRVESHTRGRSPKLAVLPDIVAGGLKSLDLSREWREKLPAYWPWYIAVQDGITPDDLLVSDWAALPGIFLGGSSAYKATAQVWCDWAHKKGIHFHYGRASTPQKLAHAIEVGADSLDSAFPLWSRKRFEWFAHCWQHGHPQQKMAV